MDLYEQQLALEEHMSAEGLARMQRQVELANKKNRGYSTPAGKMLVDAILDTATQGLKDWLDSASKRVGRPHLSLPLLKQIEPELAIFIASRVVVNAVMNPERLVSVCRMIGEQIEDEIKYTHFVEEGTTSEGNPVKPYYDKLQKGLAKRRMKGYKQITHELDRAMELHDIEWNDWSERDKMRVGEKLIDIISRYTEFVQVVHQRNRGKSKVLLYPGPGIEDLINHYNVREGLLRPLWLPCIIPPKKWTTPFDGGYHGRKLRRLRLVKAYKPKAKAYLEDLKHVEMPDVYESVNRLQETAWSVNQPVLEVVQALRENGAGVAGLPVQEDIELPPFPDKNLPDYEDLFKRWRNEAREVYEFNALNLSKRMSMERTVSIAEDFSKYENFYYPMQLDFRGRVYPVSSDLQPQGNDLSRGLLQFGEAKPIDTPEQARWLAVHLANCFGVDKVSMEERVDWVEENSELIEQVATDPLDCKWWHDADKPFQFLAACFDWAGLMSDGYGYESRLPIQMDGTCNGLQIFSLLLRDEVGGEGVNLVPKDKPQDIYQAVADEVAKDLKELLKTSPASQEGEWAERWLSFGVDRKLCKRPVMTLPYGVTEYSVKSFVYDVVREKSEGLSQQTIFGDDRATRDACNWMGSLIWEAIGRVVIAARGAMDWLRDLAKEVVRGGGFLSWTVPSGFPVLQTYHKQRSRRLKLKIGETWINGHISEDTSAIDCARQVNGIAPNFVHSLDGAALASTVCRAAEYGVTAFSMVHDSYGTHACDAQTLADSLREVFVEMFDGKDLLGELEADIREACPGHSLELKPRPPFGSLVVEQVLDSEYFFA